MGSKLGAGIVGGLVGAALALLFAPRSGEETRALIAEKMDNALQPEAGDSDFVVFKNAKMATATAGEDVRDKIDIARTRIAEQVTRNAAAAQDSLKEKAPLAASRVTENATAAAEKVGFAADAAAEKVVGFGDSAKTALDGFAERIAPNEGDSAKKDFPGQDDVAEFAADAADAAEQVADKAEDVAESLDEYATGKKSEGKKSKKD